MCALFGYVYHNVEQNVVCIASSQSYSPLNADEIKSASSPAYFNQTNVSNRFSFVILLYFLFFAFSCVLNIVKIYELKINKVIFPNIGVARWLKDILAIVAMILLHMYRLSHTGRVCAGAFKVGDESDESYLIKRGILLFAHLLIIWMIVFAICVVIFTYRVILKPRWGLSI